MTRVGVRVLVSIIVQVVAVLVGAGVAAACSCALATVEEQADNADVIARVLVTQVDRPADPQSSADPVVYTAQTALVWQGELPAEFTFTSAFSGVSCGLEGVEEGHDILLFATMEAGQATTTLCSGTSAATEERIAEVTDLLGEPVVPANAESVPEVPGSERGWLFPAAIAAVAGLGVVAVYVRRHRRDRDVEPAEGSVEP